MTLRDLVRDLLRAGLHDMALRVCLVAIARRELGVVGGIDEWIANGDAGVTELAGRYAAERLALTPRHRGTLDVLLHGQWAGGWVDLVEVSRLL